MVDRPTKMATDGWVARADGHQARKATKPLIKVQGGWVATPSARQSKPPTGGSAVMPPKKPS
jgi:hypothetical protein